MNDSSTIFLLLRRKIVVQHGHTLHPCAEQLGRTLLKTAARLLSHRARDKSGEAADSSQPTDTAWDPMHAIAIALSSLGKGFSFSLRKGGILQQKDSTVGKEIESSPSARNPTSVAAIDTQVATAGARVRLNALLNQAQEGRISKVLVKDRGVDSARRGKELVKFSRSTPLSSPSRGTFELRRIATGPRLSLNITMLDQALTFLIS